MKKSGDYFINILLSLVVVFISILIIECIFRIFIKEVSLKSPINFPSTESNYYGLPFEFLPNGDFCKNCDFYINKLGIRNSEVAIPKPQNVFRIVVLGDSHVFGGSIYSDTIPQQLQRLLNDDNDFKKIFKKDFEVINAGIPTFNLRSVFYLYHHKIRKLSPDLVLYIFHSNDLEETIYKPVKNNNGQITFVGYPSLKYVGEPLGLFSLNIDKFLIRNLVFYRYFCFVFESLRYGSQRASYEVIHSNQLKYLDKLYYETKDDKSIFVVSALLTLNSMSTCSPDDFEKEVISLFIERVSSLKIPIIDISHTLCGTPVERLDRGDNAHFSGYANSIISRHLFIGIKELIISQN